MPNSTKAKFSLDDWFFAELAAEIKKICREPTATTPIALSPVVSFAPQRNPERDIERLPSLDELKNLIEISLWTSLQRDEGRLLQFTVAYLWSCQDIRGIQFTEPITFACESLAKLSPAALLPIIVGKSEQSGLQILGMSDKDGPAFTITVIDPGKLMIKYKYHAVAVIDGQTASFVCNDDEFDAESVWDLLDCCSEAAPALKSQEKKNLFSEIVGSIRMLKHGGTLIVVPNGDLKDYEELIDKAFPYRNKNPGFYKEEIAQVKNWINQDSLPEEYWYTEISRIAAQIAQMTAVDGALIMTTAIEVVGCGAKLNAWPSGFEEMRIWRIDPLRHTERIRAVSHKDIGGTRHQSAARFVAVKRDSIGIVVSQDGHIAIYKWGRTRLDNDEQGSLYEYADLQFVI